MANDCDPDTMFEGSPIWVDWKGDAQAAIAAMEPHFKAERIRGGEMVKEAAATVAPTKTAADECETVGQWTRRTPREAIRALSVPAIVEAGDGDL